MNNENDDVLDPTTDEVEESTDELIDDPADLAEAEVED